jgi:hypothetical protein
MQRPPERRLKFAPKLETDSGVIRSTSGARRIQRGGSKQKPDFAGSSLTSKIEAPKIIERMFESGT